MSVSLYSAHYKYAKNCFKIFLSVGHNVSENFCVSLQTNYKSYIFTIFNLVHIISDMNSIGKLKIFEENLEELNCPQTDKPNA